MNQPTTNPKSATTGYLLWFFLGSFGAHRFYFGKTRSAVGMVSLFLASCVLSLIVIGLVGFVALFGWWIYDAIQINKWANEQGTTTQTEQNAPSFVSEQQDQFTDAA